MSNSKARFASGLFVLLVLFVLFFPNPRKAAAADKLRIGYGAPSVAMPVLWITHERKLFDIINSRDRN